jgi:delta-1-pyrroline-5-carboxylate synthetase
MTGCRCQHRSRVSIQLRHAIADADRERAHCRQRARHRYAQPNQRQTRTRPTDSTRRERIGSDTTMAELASSSAPPADPLTPSAARSLASNARIASRKLKALGPVARRSALQALAAALVAEQNLPRILEANALDVEAAKGAGMSPSNFARLSLTKAKLDTLAAGLRQLADPECVADPVNQLRKETIIAEGLVLQQRTVPLGVLLVIFESRPDGQRNTIHTPAAFHSSDMRSCRSSDVVAVLLLPFLCSVLPQLIGLSVLSSNGLLLKGGSESRHTLTVLYALCADAITASTNGEVDGTHLVALLTGREAVTALLALDDCIDLVIPRGGNALVSYVKSHTKIPVLGHADGVCHMYMDIDYGGQANLSNMIQLIIDSKIDYPAACNALETLLLHEDITRHTGLTGSSTAAGSILDALKGAGVTVLVGPRALAHAAARPQSSVFRGLQPAASMHTEYGDLTLCVELVPDMAAAIKHIHTYGSSHTECILTSDPVTAQTFLDQVDSACVFHNTSTRFADGFRMGLGAEVGISTSRIHARGPVGVEGLCSTKWTMVSSKEAGQPVKPFQTGEQKFIHKQVDISAKL